MASPFSVFRKRQKLMMAILCLLAMVSFVILPYLQDLIGGRVAVNKVVVETSKFGNLRESDVDALHRQRQKVLGVLGDVMQMAGLSPALVEYIMGPPTEEAAVNSWLLANHAKQLGMVISDQFVNSFLKDLTQNTVKPTNFQTAFKRSGISELQFFSAMRDELAALQVQKLFGVSLAGITPAERWDYFKRVKQTATIEALAVPVANFADKVEEPSDAELKAFFESNKDKFAHPRSPDAGFREPQRVALDYIKAEIEKFTVPTIVTDAEIKERYEKNKDRYDPKPEEKQTDEKKSDEKKPEGKEAKAPAKDAKALEAAKENAPAEKKDSKDSKEPANKEPVKTEKKEEKKTSALDTTSPFRLTSYLEDPKPADKPAEKPAAPASQEKPAAPAAQEKPAAPAAPATQEKPAATAVQEKPAEKPAAPVTPEKPAEKPTTPAAQEKPAASAAPAAQEKPAEPQTGLTESTKNRIRREIAYEKIQKVFGSFREQLDLYRQKRQEYDVQVIQNKGKDSVGLPPAKPDLEKFAKENGLTSGSTPLISQWQAQESDIGSSLVGWRDPVYNFAFQSMAKFRPEISHDLKGDLYLFWKTDEAKERIPKFEDEGVREQVLRAWKLEHARNLALKQAEATADEARKEKKHLKQVFSDRQVIMPPPFSWITFGNVPMGSAPNAARISNVTGVDFAGDDFMRATFRLKPGEVGVAFNEPKTVAYVIRLTAFDPSQDVLWKEFEVDDFNKYAPAAQSDRRQMMQGWLEEVKKSAGFKLAPDYKFDRVSEAGPRGQQ